MINDSKSEHLKNEGEKKPWGGYEVLSNRADHKVKRIVVNAGERLSLQRHQKRSEHWFVVSGEGDVTLGEKLVRLRAGESVDIPKGSLHRVSNPGVEPLVFIEIQRGDYFGEDDIERFEDDYGRLK